MFARYLLTLPVLALATAASAQSVEISRSEDRPGMIGPAETFTGTAYVAPLFDATEDRNMTAGEVTFLPGARSDWHTHPVGQVLIVTKGTGWTQERGRPRQTIQVGDVIWAPPGVEHWHGATDSSSVSHIALQVLEDDSGVTWGDDVSDDDYAE